MRHFSSRHPAARFAGTLSSEVPFDRSGVVLFEDGMHAMPVFTGMMLVEEEGLPRLPVLPGRVTLPTGCASRSLEVLEAVCSPLPGENRIAPAGPASAASRRPGSSRTSSSPARTSPERTAS